MGGRGRRSGPGGTGGKGPHLVNVTKAEIEKRIAKEMKQVPASLKETLSQAGVRLHVLSLQEVKEIHPNANSSWRGLYDPARRGAYVIVDAFQHRRGAKNAAMTALHEQGHALDRLKGKVGQPISASKAFQAAMAADRKQQQKLKLSARERKTVNYMHYPKKDRPAELFAEGFAIVYGSGRPENAPGIVKTSLFKKAWPNVLKLLQHLK